MPKNPKMALVIGMKGKPGSPDEESNEGSFPMPEGFDLDDKKTGDEFEAVCTLKVEDGGKLCVTKVEGMAVPGYDEKEESDEDDQEQPDNEEGM
jgi:hypothetical protein